MRMMIALIAIVGLVGQTMAGAVPPFDVETLVDHSDASETLNREQLFEKLDQIDVYQVERMTPVSQIVADLLYQTADKEHTPLFNDVTVAKVLAKNTIKLADCNLQGFKERAELVNSLRPNDDTELRTSGATFSVNVFAQRCLNLAADYCLRNKQDVIENEISDEEFMQGLASAQGRDGQVPDTDEEWNEDLVYNNFRTNVENFIEDELDTAVLPPGHGMSG